MIVACVWVQGNVPYTAQYVYKLQSMVARHIGVGQSEYRFVCLTDRPEQLPGIETRTIASPRGIAGWWSKLELFNPEHEEFLGGNGEGVLYLDLDSLVVSKLRPLAMWSVGQSLVLLPHAGTFTGSARKRVVHRYNSSVMSFVVGAHSDLFTRWNPAIADRLWGDQDWIGESKPNQLKFPAEWFPRISVIGANREKARGACVVLCKQPKNHVAAAMWPWVAEAWQ